MIPRPYRLSKQGYLFATYKIYYDDTELFSGLTRLEAFRIVKALNEAFRGGVDYQKGVQTLAKTV